MAHASASGGADLGPALLETYVVNDHINQIILENLDPRAWRAKPLGRNARTIAAIFTHVHNVRRKWLRLTAPHLKLPAQLDRARCTQKHAFTALVESGRRCSAMLAEALSRSESRVRHFRRDGWSKPWPAGAAMAAYMLAHEAHHRGQVCMLAHQLGYPLPSRVTSEMWSWERLWKRCGFVYPR
jgi:uncharacterized damage-inducible protein DinB